MPKDESVKEQASQAESTETKEQENSAEAFAEAKETSTEAPETETTETADQSHLEEEINKLKEQHLRLYADFENYKKRTSRERLELYSSANREMMEALLPILDDFNRALPNIEDEKAREGVDLIFNKLTHLLKQKGLKPMESAVGKDFDVETMEAITKVPAPEDAQKGKVVDEVEPGYFLGDKIIRYAKVVIGE